MKGSKDETWDDMINYKRFVDDRIFLIWICKQNNVPKDLTHYIAINFFKIDDYKEKLKPTILQLLEKSVYDIGNDSSYLNNEGWGPIILQVLLICISTVFVCVVQQLGLLFIELLENRLLWKTICFFFIFAAPHIIITNNIYIRTIIPLRNLFLQWRRIPL